ncbi:hypothetical protein D3C85_1709770 [compost metagenome]
MIGDEARNRHPVLQSGLVNGAPQPVPLCPVADDQQLALLLAKCLSERDEMLPSLFFRDAADKAHRLPPQVMTFAERS